MSLLWLKHVPWSTVLANAPGLVEGAKKLAAAMRNKPEAADPAASSELAADPGARLAALEQQQHASAELLRSLVDQNAQMAQTLAALRQRTTMHLCIAVIGLVAGLVALSWNFLR
jgi:hypothetical protein